MGRSLGFKGGFGWGRGGRLFGPNDENIRSHWIILYNSITDYAYTTKISISLEKITSCVQRIPGLRVNI